MIADCETCDRKQVPCARSNFNGRPFACFVCQGDIEDPYCELEDENSMTRHTNLNLQSERRRGFRDSKDGEPFYCKTCGMGWNEMMACEEGGCVEETRRRDEAI